jgi:hypothetical protein
MTWSYSGNPKTDEKDKYRFIIGDTDQAEPILQDEEITYILGEYADDVIRLYHLYSRAATYFARKVKRSLGPQSEEPFERQRHYEDLAKDYKQRMSSAGISLPKGMASSFKKGMHDNV